MRATSIGHAGMLIETRQGSILCDPWFEPAFFGSWFVFPRNDRLSEELRAKIEAPDYLYISHIHADHLDDEFLTHHISRDTTVLIPGFPTRELERILRGYGFRNILRTHHGKEVDLGDGLTVAIHVEVSISDGPGGDSALMVSDGETRLVNQNDCRTHDLESLAAHGPIDLHWLQYSGAIWYPMVYEETPERMRELVDAKVASQLSRAMRYVESLDARYVVPDAGPPCFLDPELFGVNMITGEELSIFPDQRVFLERLRTDWKGNGILAIPGTAIDVTPDSVTVTHPLPEAEVEAIFTDKLAYLLDYQADYLPWLEAHKATWVAPTDDLFERLRDWWEPLLAMAPMLRQALGANVLLRTGDLDVLIDFPNGQVRRHAGEEYKYRFEIQRELVETVAAARAVDWSNALFLSCRFRAWREGPFNEYVYNFFKSLSPERMRRTEAEAMRKLAPPSDTDEEIQIGEWMVERYCPHRNADLTVFGELDGCTLTCTLHGWEFDLEQGGICRSSSDRPLRVRKADLV